MIIRMYNEEDYRRVVELLVRNDVEPPQERSDLNGLCLVAEVGGTIIGSIWAMVGTSSKAYVDYLAVDKRYRNQGVAWELSKVLGEMLKAMGVKRYDFYVEQDNEYMDNIIDRHGEKNNMVRLRDLKFYRRELS